MGCKVCSMIKGRYKVLVPKHSGFKLCKIAKPKAVVGAYHANSHNARV